MIKISMREFTHHISEYMERIYKGEKFVITKRARPIADITPHNQRRMKPGWSMEMPKLKIKGFSMSETFIKYREEERS